MAPLRLQSAFADLAEANFESWQEFLRLAYSQSSTCRGRAMLGRITLLPSENQEDEGSLHSRVAEPEIQVWANTHQLINELQRELVVSKSTLAVD